MRPCTPSDLGPSGRCVALFVSFEVDGGEGKKRLRSTRILRETYIAIYNVK